MKLKTGKGRPAFRACVRNHLAQGLDSDEAESACRHADNPVFPSAIFKINLDPGPSENIAVSPGPGWRSQGTNIGTDKVVKPDPLEAASAWVRNLGRPPHLKDVDQWKEFARRMGLGPEDSELGWTHITRGAKMGEALVLLRSAFGEGGSPPWSGSWSGYWVPMKQMIDPNKRQVSPRPDDEEHPEDANLPERRKKLKRKLGERIGVNVKTHQAPQVGNARGQAQKANENPGFGFRTWSARKVYETALSLIALYPLAKPADLIGMAVRKSGVLTTELTPEDDQLLKIAIDWAQNGPARTNIRTGGTPGGPFRSTGQDHYQNPLGNLVIP
jgi:hypothetical protein